MNRRSALTFLVGSTVMFTMAYLIAGGLSYQLLTKQFYVGPEPVFAAYLRSEANPAEWSHTSVWLVPALLARAVLVSVVLLPFREALRQMGAVRGALAVFGLVFVLQHLAAGAPSPSNIEGLLYMKPALISLRAFLLTQPEMLLQAILFAAGVTWLLARRAEGRPR
jgi:hypothetical protein